MERDILLPSTPYGTAGKSLSLSACWGVPQTPGAEMLTHSCRTPQNVVATLRLQKKKPKAGHYAIASGFPHTLTVLLLLLFLFLLLFFLLFDLKKTIHVGLDRLQFLIFLP